MKSQKGVAIGTVVGGVVGATAALLTAPKPGEELREDISNQIVLGKAKTEDIAYEFKTKMSELSSLINESSSNVSKTVRERSEQLINEASSLLKSAPSKENITVDDLREMVRVMMKEEMEMGQEIKKVVEEEINTISNKMSQDSDDESNQRTQH
ncbi:YtxH domain-containing protein [Bacillus suaedae]|uniref:YtxH domain-containing protein n=1 Tax=Halalkalibacter suaedae TaxID=2822140 RepID=A0A940WXK5_9BACI|nr:YtxH domain-containing protein [Bacillus suaedae]MBP3950106.1 YtxH domain-containing protein [Bacillus suaedae]